MSDSVHRPSPSADEVAAAVPLSRRHALRLVNEQIRRLTPSGTVAGFHCECGDAHCAEVLGLTGADYELLRRRPGTAIVAPGHRP